MQNGRYSKSGQFGVASWVGWDFFLPPNFYISLSFGT